MSCKETFENCKRKAKCDCTNYDGKGQPINKWLCQVGYSLCTAPCNTQYDLCQKATARQRDDKES